MIRTHLARMGAFAAALAIGATATALGLSGPASAQTAGCAGVGGPALVTIDRPSPGSVVSGTVQVQGTAQAALVGISRVEISFGDKQKNFDYESSGPVEFDTPFDTSGMDPGQTPLKVVACSGVIARGVSEISVMVRPAAVPTTTPGGRSATTVGAPLPGQGITSTTSGTPTTKVGQPLAGQVTSTAPPATEPRVEVFKPEPVRPKSGPDAPLVLTETPARRSPRPPLWVGGVVGVSGAIGLAFSAASWRRRTHLPEAAEPLDPDLVEVG